MTHIFLQEHLWDIICFAVLEILLLGIVLFFILFLLKKIRLRRKSQKSIVSEENDNNQTIFENKNTEIDRLTQDNERLNDKIKDLEEDIKNLRALNAELELYIDNDDSLTKMKKEIERSEGIAQYYKRQLDMLQNAPSLKNVILDMLPLISALKDYENIKDCDKSLYISMLNQKFVRLFDSQNMAIIRSNIGDDYNPEIHKAVGTVVDDSGNLKGKIQVSVCCGIQYYDGSIEKEEVILFI